MGVQLDTKKVMISIDDTTLADLDAYASRNCVSRSSAIRILCRQALDANNTVKVMDELVKAYKAEIARKTLSEGL